MPDLWLILSWLYHGLTQYALYWIPLLNPFPEEEWPPGAWWWSNTWDDWFGHLDGQRRPDEYLIQRWFVMIATEGKRLVLREAREYVDGLYDWLANSIGGIRWDFPSLGAWLGVVEDRIGYALPWWVTTLADAVDWLRDRLPESIREGWKGWDTLFEEIGSGIRDWVALKYDYAKSVAIWARDWITEKGVALDTWWNDAHVWLDWFREDSYAALVGLLGEVWDWVQDFRDHGPDRVRGWLGPDFPRLLTFSRDCVGFYYNLWSIGWSELVDLVTDPRAWVIRRVERALEERW